MEVGLLTEIMNAFVEAFSGGFDRIRPAVSALLYLLIGIEVAWFGVLFTLGMESVASGLRKIMAIGLWTFIALHFDQHAFALVDSLVKAGLLAAGSQGSARTLLNPSAILDVAFTTTQPLADQVLKGSLLSINGTYIMFGLTWLLMMLAFTALAINAFVVMIDYYLAVAVVGILVPFGVLAPTRWIAMKPMSYFLSCGLKMMVIAFLIAISRNVMTRIHFTSAEPTLREMWVALCCTGMIGVLCWKGPERVAAGFMAGAASLGGSDLTRHTQAVASGTTRVAGTAASALSGIAGATAGAAQALYMGARGYAGHGPGPASGAGSRGYAGSGNGSGGASAMAFTASAAGPGTTSLPPVLVPPSGSPSAPKKE